MTRPLGCLPPQGKPTGLDLGPIIRQGTPYFLQLRQAINQAVIEDYAAAREYVARTFEEQRKVYDFGRTWNVAAWSQNGGEQAARRPHAQACLVVPQQSVLSLEVRLLVTPPCLLFVNSQASAACARSACCCTS